MQTCGSKIKQASKFIDFFVHDILDYTIINQQDKPLTKNIEVFDVKEAVLETLNILCDKVKMKGISVNSRFEGFSRDKNIKY